MAEERKCNGRCEQCSPNQRTYCSAQKALYMEQDVAEIKAMLQAMLQNSGGEITILATGQDTSVKPPTLEQEEYLKVNNYD